MLQEALEAWAAAKQALREQHSQGAAQPEGAALPGEVIKIKELEDVVQGHHSAGSTACKGMLVIDCSKRASVFFR